MDKVELSGCLRNFQTRVNRRTMRRVTTIEIHVSLVAQAFLPEGDLCTTLPPIPEEVAAFKERLQHAHDGHKKPRLQMLYRLASGQAHRRQEVARFFMTCHI
jgi:hypothetical protein